MLYFCSSTHSPFSLYARAQGINEPIEEKMRKCIATNPEPLVAYSWTKQAPADPNAYKKHSIIAMRSWPLGPYEAVKMDPDVKVYKSSDMVSAVDMFLAKRADFLITYSTAAEPIFIQRKKDVSQFVVTQLFALEGFPVVMPIDYPNSEVLCNRVKTAYQALVDEGVIDAQRFILKTDVERLAGKFGEESSD